MKVKENCAHCGKRARKITIEVDAQEREAFITFTENVQRSTDNPKRASLFIPPSKYKSAQLVIPSPGQNPCGHCKHGSDSVGPTGCGRGDTCMALMYYRLHQLAATTDGDPRKAVTEFTCTVPNATWVVPPRKNRVRSVEASLFQMPTTSSEAVPSPSSAKSELPSSKWPSSSKAQSVRTKRR